MAKLGQKPNGIYYLDVQVPDGSGNLKRSRVGCKTRDRVEAERQLKEWKLGTHELHFSKGVVVAPKGRIDELLGSVSPKARPTGFTMEQLFDKCWSDNRCWALKKAQKTIRSNIKLLNERIGDVLVVDMTRKRLVELVEAMEADGYAPGSIKRKMDMVSKALRMAAEVYEDANGKPLLAAKPPMPKLEVRNTTDRILTYEEEALVFAAIDARIDKESMRQWVRFRMLIRVLLDTGFRLGEAQLLGPDSIVQVNIGGVSQPFLSLPRYETKSDKPRMIPATPAVMALVPKLNAIAVKGKWFPFKGSSAWYMWDNVRHDLKLAGHDLDDVKVHTLRHTCITRLALGGMELQRLSMWAGHADVSITASRYSHLDVSALAGGLAILGASPTSGDNSHAIPESSGIPDHHVYGGIRATDGTARLQ